MERDLNSFSSVVSEINGDIQLGKSLIIDCINEYEGKRIIIKKLDDKLNREILNRDSITNSVMYICKHLKIETPCSISYKGDMYIIGNDYKLSIVKSDFNLDV